MLVARKKIEKIWGNGKLWKQFHNFFCYLPSEQPNRKDFPAKKWAVIRNLLILAESTNCCL